MQYGIRIASTASTERKAGLLPALAAALLLHAVILLIPFTKQSTKTAGTPAQIELQLTAFKPQAPALPDPDQTPDAPPVETEPELPPRVITEPDTARVMTETVQPIEPPLPEPAPETEQDPKEFPEQQLDRLTSTILSRQFFTEESEADKIFGKPVSPPGKEPQKAFHYPVRPNMITMLDKPMPDLPFAYTPGLVHFAYDPGVKGDIQRFWDAITPEFGWRTDNGTEVRCKLILIIAGCAWK